jgi:RNA polymerase sigma-70 factor (ECF subfamily)
MIDPRTDEDLLADYLDGEVAAFRALVERYHDPLLRFLIRLSGGRAAAEDVFQETFLQVHQSAATFDGSKRFKPWLFTIAANKGRDALRRRQRRPAMSLSAGIDADSERSFVDLLEIDVPDVSERMDQQELAAAVQRAIDRLTPRLKEVLLLAYFQKLGYQQIAEVLGIPLGTVKSRLHAAVASFAKAWQAEARLSDPEALGDDEKAASGGEHG